MEKSLYPKTFLHFTSKINSLEKILTDGFFKPSYAREHIYGKDEVIRYFGIPMVSFCNIRLSLLSAHTKKYGHYGIGLTSEWANKNNLNPVLYMNRHADTFELLDSQLRKIFKGIDKESCNSETLNQMKDYLSLVNILRYIKNHTGPLIRKEREREKYCFADEMEWRFVPPISDSSIKPIVLLKNISDAMSKQEHNDRISHIHLDFDINDISYIILKNESQLPRFIGRLRKNGCIVNDSLISKIFYSTQINNDL